MLQFSNVFVYNFYTRFRERVSLFGLVERQIVDICDLKWRLEHIIEHLDTIYADHPLIPVNTSIFLLKELLSAINTHDFSDCALYTLNEIVLDGGQFGDGDPSGVAKFHMEHGYYLDGISELLQHGFITIETDTKQKMIICTLVQNRYQEYINSISHIMEGRVVNVGVVS